MSTLSTVTRTAHEVGLATAALGGSMFGRAAFQPALRGIENPEDRDRIASEAWRRFSWLNLAAQGAFALTWFAGRSMLRGHARGPARSLTRIKDGLVIASVATSIGGIVLGRQVRNCGPEGNGENVISAANRVHRKDDARRIALRVFSVANLLAAIGIVGISTALAAGGKR